MSSESGDGTAVESLQKLKALQITSLEEEEDDEDQVNGESSNLFDEDDDEEEEQVAVTLGFVEKPKKRWSLLRQLFPSKAGGSPAWLDPIDLPSGRSCLCDICGEPLQFLLQVLIFIIVENIKQERNRTTVSWTGANFFLKSRGATHTPGRADLPRS